MTPKEMFDKLGAAYVVETPAQLKDNLAKTGDDATGGSGVAYYNRNEDLIHLPTAYAPALASHRTEIELHELSHWANQPQREGQPASELAALEVFGRDAAYSVSEVVAEVSAGDLSRDLMGRDIGNQVGIYLLRYTWGMPRAVRRAAEAEGHRVAAWIEAQLGGGTDA